MEGWLQGREEGVLGARKCICVHEKSINGLLISNYIFHLCAPFSWYIRKKAVILQSKIIAMKLCNNQPNDYVL